MKIAQGLGPMCKLLLLAKKKKGHRAVAFETEFIPSSLNSLPILREEAQGIRPFMRIVVKDNPPLVHPLFPLHHPHPPSL